MVTVDDATYVKMKDTLYGGDAGKASRAKAQIEANYDDAKYNDFMNQLNGMQSQTSASSSNNFGPADGYATATDRNMATGGAEFGRNNQTSNTPATPTTNNSNKGGETVVTSDTEIKQEGALKPLSQDYYNQTSQEAQDKIVKNLNDYKQSNPEYFRDYESFKKNFSYDARDDVQKNTLDEWYKGYQEGLSLASTPTTDLYTQYKNGNLSDTQLQSLRVSDPNKYSDLMNQINKGNIIAAYDDDKGVDTGLSIQEMAYNMMQQTFMQFMNGGSESGASQYFRDYEEKMNSPEMMELSDQTTELQEQIENVQDDIAAMTKAVEKEYEGTGASRAKISAIVADRTYELQLQLRTLNSEYNKYATQYNNRMQQYQNEFQLQLQEYQINQQERNQMMSELGFAMDLMSFETPQQKQDRERDYWVKQQEYTNGDINSKDYSTRYKAALKSVQNLLSQYEGIPMVRSAEQMAQDILKAIDGGSDLGAELTKINQQIQQKPEYEAIYNATYGVYNGYTISSNGTFGLTNSYNANYTPIEESTVVSGLDNFIKNNPTGKTGGQCGKFVNDYLQSIGVGRIYSDPIDSKTATINSDIPTVGGVVVFDYTGNPNATDAQKQYGHVAIIQSVDYQNGTITTLESNKKGEGQIFTRTLSFKDPSIAGFFNPSQTQDTGSATYLGQKFASNIDWNKDGYINSLSKDYESYLEKGKDAITDSQWKALKEDYGINEQDFRLMAQNYAKTAGKKNGVEQASKALESAVKLYEMLETGKTLGLKDNPQGGLLDWGVSYVFPMSDAGEARAEYKTLMSRLQLNELFNAKNNGASFGAMSDSEWDILGSAATDLKWDSSSKTFKTNLEYIIKSLNDAVVQGGGTLPNNFRGSKAQGMIGGDTAAERGAKGFSFAGLNVSTDMYAGKSVDLGSGYVTTGWGTPVSKK